MSVAQKIGAIKRFGIDLVPDSGHQTNPVALALSLKSPAWSLPARELLLRRQTSSGFQAILMAT